MSWQKKTTSQIRTRIITQVCFDCNGHNEQRKRCNGCVIFCTRTANSAGSSMTCASGWSGCLARICRSTTHLYVPCWRHELHWKTRTGAKFGIWGNFDGQGWMRLASVFFTVFILSLRSDDSLEFEINLVIEWLSCSSSWSSSFADDWWEIGTTGCIGGSESWRMIFNTFDSTFGCLRAWCFLFKTKINSYEKK